MRTRNAILYSHACNLVNRVTKRRIRGEQQKKKITPKLLLIGGFFFFLSAHRGPVGFHSTAAC